MVLTADAAGANSYDHAVWADAKLVIAEDAMDRVSRIMVEEVIALIDAIGEDITADSIPAINAARKAYDALDPYQKEKVLNLPVLEAAEATLIEIGAAIEQTCHFSEWVEPGVVSWTWLAEGETLGGQQNITAVKEYIDMAATLGWKYFLWDAGWQTDPARNSMIPEVQEVIDYAAARGIGILVWVDEDYLDTPQERDSRFSVWSEMGIKGIKADFFDNESLSEIQEYKAMEVTFDLSDFITDDETYTAEIFRDGEGRFDLVRDVRKVTAGDTITL